MSTLPETELQIWMSCKKKNDDLQQRLIQNLKNATNTGLVSLYCILAKHGGHCHWWNYYSAMIEHSESVI